MKPILFVVGLSLLGTLSVVQAQEAPLSEAERTAVIADLTTLLNDRYVIPEMADRLESLLRHKAEQGAYADLTDRATFAQTLTHDLQDLSNDKHLRVSYGEIGAAVDSGSPRRVVRRVPGGTGSGGAQPVRRVGGRRHRRWCLQPIARDRRGRGLAGECGLCPHHSLSPAVDG